MKTETKNLESNFTELRSSIAELLSNAAELNTLHMVLESSTGARYAQYFHKFQSRAQMTNQTIRDIRQVLKTADVYS